MLAPCKAIKLNGLSAGKDQYLLSKNPKEKKTLLKQINRYQKKLGLKVTEDMGSVTGAHIAGTGDDNTVHTKPKKRRLAKRLRKYGLKQVKICLDYGICF